MKKYKFKIYALWGVGNQFEENEKSQEKEKENEI